MELEGGSVTIRNGRFVDTFANNGSLNNPIDNGGIISSGSKIQLQLLPSQADVQQKNCSSDRSSPTTHLSVCTGLENAETTTSNLSNRPLFELPASPRAVAVSLINKPIQSQQQSSPVSLTVVPSSFPSPYSAFTELQPKALRTVSFVKSPLLPRMPFMEVASSSVCTKRSPISERSTKPGPITLDTSSISTPSWSSAVITYCSTCGQTHDPNAPHRYNYTQSVDADLCCMLCHQPLVAPLDTKCGHTFCTLCLKNHLTVQALCPVDRQIINYLECQQASKIVERLLDKLLVACPNTQFCNTVIPRCELEEHVRDWCAGTFLCCDNAVRGCMFSGPRVFYLQHRWKCPYASCVHSVSGNVVIQRSSEGPAGHGLIAMTIPNQQAVDDFPLRTVSTHSSPSQHRVIGKCDHLKSELKPHLSDIDETYDSPTILDGSPVSVVIRRTESRKDWGYTFVGGLDTPLACILIQEIYLDGAVAGDGRLRPGDQILEVDGRPLLTATHGEARQQLNTHAQSIQLVVFRESFNWSPSRSSTSQSEEEIFPVKLCKQRSKVLGIKLVGKKHMPGLYVLELVAGCEAQLDGRLRKDDRILEINGIDLTEGTQEQAASIINSASDFVEFKVSRRLRADTPDIVRITSQSGESTSLPRAIQSFRCAERMRNSSLNRCNVHQPRLRKCESDDPVKRVPSPSTLTSSRLTETSSLNAYHASSSETDVTSNPISQPNLDDYEVRKHFISGFTSASHSPANRTAEIQSQRLKPLCEEKVVAIEKSLEEPLGISVAGGRNSQRGDTPIYVTNIREQSVLGRNKLIKRGDVLLEVNDTGLVGLTHQEAVAALRSISSSCCRIQIRIINSPETCDDSENFLPSWTFWIQLPPVCQLTRVIHLKREKFNEGPEPLGFSILGGTECEHSSNVQTRREKFGYTSVYPSPIVVKSIVPGMLAHRDGRLKCGDLILAVNNISMLDISHETAVKVLKTIDHDVELRIISWPGTIV